MLKISGIQAGEMEACCKFDYMRLVISASTIFSPPNSIHVIDPRSDDLVYEATSVEDAIEWVDDNFHQFD